MEAGLKARKDRLLAVWKGADETLKGKNDKDWASLQLNRTDKALEVPFAALQAAVAGVQYWYEAMHWL